MTTPEELQSETLPEDDEKIALGKRLDKAAWGLFLIILGCLWLIPDEKIHEDTWLLGAGVILLGLNAVRFIAGIRMNGFTIFLGVLGLLLGIGGIFGLDLPVFPILIILLGLSILIEPLFKRR